MTTQSPDYQDVLKTVRSWEPALRLALAEELLRSLHPLAPSGGVRGVPAQQVLGLAAGAGSPPDDDTVRRWIEEYRAGKYGTKA
jgi:hypothetical protein